MLHVMHAINVFRGAIPSLYAHPTRIFIAFTPRQSMIDSRKRGQSCKLHEEEKSLTFSTGLTFNSTREYEEYRDLESAGLLQVLSVWPFKLM